MRMGFLPTLQRILKAASLKRYSAHFSLSWSRHGISNRGTESIASYWSIQWELWSLHCP